MTAQAPDFNEITKNQLPSDPDEAIVRVLEEMLMAINNLDHRIKRQDESLRHPNGYYPLLNRMSELGSIIQMDRLRRQNEK